MATITAKTFMLLLAFASTLANPLKDERIIGGQTAPNGAFRYQVSLRTNNNHFCGGSIISPYWILSAAHCFIGITNANAIQVVVGTNYLNSGGTFYQTAQVIVHSGFTQQQFFNDIALVRVTNPIRYASNIQPIALSNTKASPGWWCLFSGWGTTSYPAIVVPNALQNLKFYVISNENCRAALANGPFGVGNGQTCTLNTRGQGLCKGDSGGPLVCGNQQYGIASWVIYCATGAPDVLTAVSAYRDWIYSYAGV